MRRIPRERGGQRKRTPVSDPARTAMASKLAGSETGAPTAATSGLPTVSVPVLSKITAVIFPAFSKATPSRIKMPRRAAALAPAMIAAGVAKPIAHGQAIIKTAAAMINPAAAPTGACECQKKLRERSREFCLPMPAQIPTKVRRQWRWPQSPARRRCSRGRRAAGCRRGWFARVARRR